MAEILVLGAGSLGNRFAEYFGDQAVLGAGDITDLTALEALIEEHRPKIVINAAAKTNTAEIEKSENQQEAFLVNVQGPALLMMLALKHDFRLVHLSTGMMFDGGPISEDMMPAPTCYYAWTKAWGDAAIAPYLEATKSLILRLHIPFSSQDYPRNFLVKVQKFTSFADVAVTMTRVEDLLEVTDRLLKSEASGIYNVANPEPITFVKIAQIMQEHGLLPADLEVKGVGRVELDAQAEQKGSAKQTYPVLSTEKLAHLGISLPTMTEAITECAKALAK